MASTAHIRPGLYAFLRDLKKNNDRDWFHANKDRYETQVRQPLLELINDFRPHLKKISTRFVADPRPVGGSLFRIHRDVRFSKDKSPYKTHAGMHFRHEAAKDVHAPGFYVHLEPGSVFVGAGIWHPDGAAVKKIRTAIAEDPKAWKRAVAGKAYASRFEQSGDRLVRPPKGFDPEDPVIEDLKWKDYIGVAALKQSDTTKPTFITELAKLCKASSPFMKFLTNALDLPY